MKSIAVAVLMLLASANTLPTLSEDELRQERLMNDAIINIIKGFSQSIKEAGLDPYEVANAQGQFALSEPEVFSAVAFVEDFSFKGLSDIAINDINFSILASRLTFDLSLPKLAVRVGASGFEVILLGRELDGQGSGSLKIMESRLRGDVRIRMGAISGITVHSLDLKYSLGGIVSNLKLTLFGCDISAIVNNYLGNTLPNALNESQAEINELIEYIAWKIIDRFL